MRIWEWSAALGLMSLALACSETSELHREGERSWGETGRTEAAAAEAKQAIDASALADQAEAARRVLSMSMSEAIARIGPLSYKSTAEFEAKRGKRAISVFERTRIQVSEDGSYRVLQENKAGTTLRELVYSGGQLYVRNGPGALRRRELGDAPHEALRQQAFEPLSTFTAGFGPRLKLKALGAGSVAGRPVSRYALSLAPGGAVEIDGRGALPKSLSGKISVDEATGVVLSAKLEGKLSRLAHKTGGKKTAFDYKLDYALRPKAVPPIAAKGWVPEIHRRPVDLNPLAFLKGGTHTSTVIGGKKR